MSEKLYNTLTLAKCVIVGMRYVQGATAEVAKLQKRESILPGQWRFKVEHNKDGVYGLGIKCLRVEGSDNIHIGWVRNRDVQVILESLLQRKKTITTTSAEIKAVEDALNDKTWMLSTAHDNYLVLAPNTEVFLVALREEPKLDNVFVSEKNTQPIKQKEGNKMNFANLKSMLFREVKDVGIDMQTGNLGVSTKDGIISYSKGTLVSNPLLDLFVSVPMFAMRTPIKSLAVGDIVIDGAGGYAFFEAFDVQSGAISAISVDGSKKVMIPVTNLFLGADSVLAIKSILGNIGGEGLGGNPLLLAMMLSDGKSNMDSNKMLMLAMMGGMAGGGGVGMNPLLMAMMLGKD